MTRLHALPLLLAALLLGACAATKPRVVFTTEARYPPTVTVERLHTLPSRPHEVIAELSWSTTTEETLRDSQARLAETARQLGANAVVFGRRHNRGMGQASDLSGTSAEYYSLTATALRWRER